MAIVAENVSDLGGTIQIKSIPSEGTTFTITLPQTVTTFRGILVTASHKSYLIPTSTIHRAITITPADIRTIESKNTVMVNGEAIGVVSLGEVLEPGKVIPDKRSSTLQALILHDSHKKIAFIVDEIHGEHEGIVKNLGPQLVHVKNIAGANIMGDGKIVPVIHVHELMQTVQGKGESLLFKTELREEDETAGVTRILLAEDSITVRNMLRNYLESAGYDVTTTVNGQEAYQKLGQNQFDVVVSDVEMPIMNGFELTTMIRQHPEYSELPVILVTALETREDRKRGLEAGASAYIVKSSFEKGNLIETIRRVAG